MRISDWSSDVCSSDPPFRINKISDAVHVGEKVQVMIKEIDEKGRLNLSIKAADPDFAARRGLHINNEPKTNEGDGRGGPLASK